MRTGRNGSRRSFTVEVKSGERGATVIPSRVTAPTKPAPRAFATAPAEASVPATEKRRILPSLIVPEPQTEPAAEEVSPPRKRGRPRKVQPFPDEPVTLADPVSPAPPPAATASVTSPTRSATRKPGVKPGTVPPAGERWKRRLGRWAR